jgi:uncharacterized protein (DUF3820 family)
MNLEINKQQPFEMEFGKHKGTCISKLPADYLLWLLFEKKTMFSRVQRYPKIGIYIFERKEELIAKSSKPEYWKKMFY